MVENEAHGKFFQIGLPQYTFLSLLDGSRTVSSALMKTATLLGINAIDEEEAAQLAKWAIESGLIESEKARTKSRKEKSEDIAVQKSMSILNPITLRIPFFCPDNLAETANRYLGWIISPGGLMVWLVVIVAGLIKGLEHQEAFINHRVTTFSPYDIVWFAVAWLLLKLVHETAHCLVCKRYGGQIHSCGMLLLLLIPMPYVDVTSSWRFDNKWHRVWTAAAGMMIEIFIAAIAVYVWVETPPGPLKYHAGNLIIAATLHTLLFNANPLMKFDGYYMLSDTLEIPNLATRGKQYVKSAFSYLYFGKKSKPIPEMGYRGIAIKIYGFLATLWFFSISLGLSLAAASLFEGFGLVLAVVGTLLWFGIPTIRFIKYVITGSKTEQPNRTWFSIAAGATLAVIGVFLFACPSPSVVSAPIVIDFENLSIIRAQTPGFVRSIHVVHGQHVNQGELMISMENRELSAELESLQVDLEISKLRSRTLLTEGDIASWKLEGLSIESMEERVQELSNRIDKLNLYAPRDGAVIASNLDSQVDVYLQPGDEVLSVGKPDEIQAIALASQRDAQWIKSLQERKVDLLVWGQTNAAMAAGTIVRINPRARDDFPHDAFAASNGGPLAVVARNQVESSNEEAGEESLILTEPRVEIEIALQEENCKELKVGQGGVMMVRSRDESMGAYLASNFMNFIRKNSYRSHGL